MRGTWAVAILAGGSAACGATTGATDAAPDAALDVVANAATDAAAGTDAMAEDAAPEAADVSPTVCQPYCGGIGTKSERWCGGCTGVALHDPSTGFPMWDLCAKCVAVCKLNASKSEGWYSSCSDKLIQWDNCM